MSAPEFRMGSVPVHFTVDPNARYEWDKLSARHTLTMEEYSLAKAVQDAAKLEPGTYTLEVKIEVRILAKRELPIPIEATDVLVA